MKKIVFLFLLCSCNNDAIDVARRLDPQAVCQNTKATGEHDRDIAICTQPSTGQTWYCTSLGCRPLGEFVRGGSGAK